MFTFKERSDEELLELLKADKFDEFAEEISKSYVNQKLQEPTSQEQQNDDSENAVLMEVDSTGQLLYEESETDNSEKSTETRLCGSYRRNIVHKITLRCLCSIFLRYTILYCKIS